MDIEEALNEIDLRVCDLANSIKKYQDYIDGVKKPTAEHLIFATMMVIAKSVVRTASAHIEEAREVIKIKNRPQPRTESTKNVLGRKVTLSVNEKREKVK